MRCSLKPLCLSLLLTSGGHLCGAEVYRCQVPGSPMQFSQFPCSPGTRSGPGSESPAAVVDVVQERLNPGAAQVVEIPALSRQELRSLHQAERRAASREQTMRASRLRNAEALRRQRAGRADRCRAARRGLQQLADRKRKGYTLNDSRKLAERELALKSEASLSCRN